MLVQLVSGLKGLRKCTFLEMLKINFQGLKSNALWLRVILAEKACRTGIGYRCGFDQHLHSRPAGLEDTTSMMSTSIWVRVSVQSLPEPPACIIQ